MSRLSSVRLRLVLHALGVVLSLGAAGSARADERPAPTPEQVQAAAESFDRGRDAYKAGRFAEAAEQFERADSNAPSATALELAIKARDKAGDLDRAATLALLAVDLYASEVQSEETGLGKVAPPLLDRARQELYELEVQCSEPCSLLDGKKIVHGQPAAQRSIFLSPGQHELVAGFGEGRTQAKSVTAIAAGSGELAFEAPPMSPAEVAPPPVADPQPTDAPVDADKSPGWSPTVFFVGVGLTVATGGVTVWSGLDTKNDPGAERVKKECAAGDTECDLYQEGLAKQTRTNVLIGITSGLALATGLVGAFAIDWGSGGSPNDQSAKVRRKIQPTFGWANGPKLGARGTF